MTLRLGVPSKGRLMEETFRWFARRGIILSRPGSEREYAGMVQGIDGMAMVFLSAGEIPRELASGRIQLGVTGIDLVREKLPRSGSQVVELVPMDFGYADLLLAVPRFWVDVDTLDDLDAVAAEFRTNHGHRLRIATKYHRLVREFLGAAGVADYALVDSQGATEGAVKYRIAEAIADISTTGETLAANHLKRLSDGLILHTRATVWQSTSARLSQAEQETMDALRNRLRSSSSSGSLE